MTSVGVQKHIPKKLKVQEGKTFTTAAFPVSASDTSRDIFYQADTWPAGAELRDWYFKSPNIQHNQQHGMHSP